MIVFPAVVILGFEFSTYDVSESSVSVDVCVQVFPPAPDAGSRIGFGLTFTTVPGTAGKLITNRYTWHWMKCI